MTAVTSNVNQPGAKPTLADASAMMTVRWVRIAVIAVCAPAAFSGSFARREARPPDWSALDKLKIRKS